jgi:hypothetical protein
MTLKALELPPSLLRLMRASEPRELTLIPTGYLSLTDCVHRVAQHRDPEAAAELAAARHAHETIQPLLEEIDRIQELKRSVRKPAPPIPLEARGRQSQWMKAKNELYKAHQESVMALPIPQLTPEQLKLQEDFRVAKIHYAPVQSAAEVFLRRSFADEKSQTFFQRSSDGELEGIPAPRWRTGAGINAFANGLWMSNPGPSCATGLVLVREADLEALLLSENGSPPAPADSEDSSAAPVGSVRDDNVAPPLDHAPAEAAEPTTPERPPARRPPYSPDACRAWFVFRVRTWPTGAPLPTEVEDRKAAEVDFEGKIPRDEFRKIRIERTPETWRKSGPRGPRR